jgi:hypothetical protein
LSPVFPFAGGGGAILQGGLSQRVRPEVAGPMTGSAKPTVAPAAQSRWVSLRYSSSLNLRLARRDQTPAARRTIMSAEAKVSIERLRARIARLESANRTLCVVVSFVVALFLISTGAALMAPHFLRANAVRQSIAPCATSKAMGAACRTPGPRLRVAGRASIDA